MKKIKTFIFTNNNLVGLNLLLESLPAFLDESLYIFDDNSSYKINLQKEYTVYQTKQNQGLFANMAYAIKNYVEPDDFVLILQDDIQFVYDINRCEFENYINFLESNNFDQIDIRFIRSSGYGNYLQKNISLGENYYLNKDYPYTDIGLWKGISLTKKLLPLISSIGQMEFKSTSTKWGKERSLGVELGSDFKSCLHKNPFLAHTPYPRYRFNTLNTRIYNFLASILPSRFKSMSPSSWDKFCQRPLEIIPMDFLFLSVNSKFIFFYYAVQPGFKGLKALFKHP